MPYRIIATLQGGNVLQVDFPDAAAVDAQLRAIAHLRKHRWGFPEIFWVTTTGERWCLSIYDFDGPLVVEVADEVATG